MRNLTALFVALFLIVLGFLLISFIPKPNQNAFPVKYGVSFSPRYARYLKLDFQKTFLQILDELKVKNFRLPTYWTSLQSQEGKYDFSETDFMIDEAGKRGARIILVVGARQPRWPECHYPDWAKKLSVSSRQQKTLEFVGKVVERYKDSSAIWAYQVENEPFAWWFGENCDPPDAKFLQSEVDLVKKLDPKKPIVITDSGELGFWVESISNADILGSSVYRKSYNTVLHAHIPYPFPVSYYQLKANLVKKLPGQQNKKILITELQAEPWLSGTGGEEATPLGQARLFTLEEFKNNLEFVKKIGFEEDYLWGVEWWYFMKENGYSEYLEYAKELFK